MNNFLETLKERIVVFDGAMGTNLQAQDLTVDDYGGPQFEGCPEYLLVTKPEAIEKVHTAFFDVGCDVIETNSFGGLIVGDTASHTPQLNKRRRVARRIAAAIPQGETALVASDGAGTKLPTLATLPQEIKVLPRQVPAS